MKKHGVEWCDLRQPMTNNIIINEIMNGNNGQSMTFSLVYQPPEIATLKHGLTPHRGERVIYQSRNLGYQALHEVGQHNGEQKTVECVDLSSLTEAQFISRYLGTHAWQRIWDR